MNENITNERALKRLEELKQEGDAAGYILNPDLNITLPLVEGLLVNTDRYLYPSCPCRLATGKKTKDLDIICPCDYRDMDLDEFGSCYCGLYVSQEVFEKQIPFSPIPERRQRKNVSDQKNPDNEKSSVMFSNLSYTVWRCRVCGYLCARDAPPSVCPVCKATKERFECFIEKK